VRRESSQWWVDINQLDLGVREIANEYSVKGTYKKIMETSSTPTNLSWLKIWNKSIPSKVSCLVCRLFQNKIATKDNLFRRGDISQGSLLCCSGCVGPRNRSSIYFLNVHFLQVSGTIFLFGWVSQQLCIKMGWII
jgi:hypothetical protein